MIDNQVFVTLERDADGYPPWDEEAIWATPIGDNTYRLDASPTFVRGLSCRDIVSVVPVADRWYAEEVVESGGHSTVRVVLFDDAHHDEVVEIGRRHECEVSHTEISGLFSIDVPPAAGYAALLDELRAGQLAGSWDVDEGKVADSHASEE